MIRRGQSQKGNHHGRLEGATPKMQGWSMWWNCHLRHPRTQVICYSSGEVSYETEFSFWFALASFGQVVQESSSEKQQTETSLVVLWLRIHLPMQRTQARCLVRALRSQVRWSKSAHTVQLLSSSAATRKSAHHSEGSTWGSEDPVCCS